MKSIPVRRHCIGVVRVTSKSAHINGNNPQPCPGWAHKGSEYCFLHDPTIPKQRRSEIAAKGGHAGKGKRRFNLKTPRSIERCISLSLNQIFSG